MLHLENTIGTLIGKLSVQGETESSRRTDAANIQEIILGCFHYFESWCKTDFSNAVNVVSIL